MLNFVFGPSGQFEPEHRCLNGMCAFLAIILFVSIPFNQWIRPDKALAIGGLVFGLGFCFLYYLARVKTVFLPVYWGCIGFASAFTLLSWIYTDGISGPTIIFSLIILSLANLIVTGKNRLISILLLCGPMGLLFFGQYLWPSAIVAYASGPARFIDLYTTYFMAAVTLSFVMHLTMAHLKSEQKKARQNEKRLMAILDNIPDMVWFKDKNTKFVMANQAFANFVGLQPENIINKSCADLWPEKLAEQFEKEDLRILETGFPIKNQRLIKDRQNKLRRFQVVKKSLKGQTRSTDGIMGISRDITIRHEYEEQLKQYKRIVDTSQDQIALINRAYQYEAVSDSYLKAYGFEENQMLGKTIPEVLGESIFETKIKPRLDKGFSGQMFNIQDEIKYKGIGNRQVDITICPYTDHSGKTNRLVVHIRDISEKIQMEKQLVTSQKMEAIGTLAGGIAHDFNNILSGILGYAQLGKLNLDHPEKLTRHLEQIIKGSNRAVDMVRQILTFSRKYQYKKHPLKIALIVKEAAKLLRASIPSFIEIKTQVSSQSTILADPTHIHQVIMNLCTNSFQAISGDKGLLSIQLDDVILTREEIRQETKILPGAYVKLRVRDTGTGMDDHTLEKIFNPYFTTKETGQGTGMGLSIVHGIVQDHGGFILVDSQLNKGTCFSVFFPVHDREKDSRPPGETDPILPGQKETIMVVDDEPSVLESSVEFLKDLGYQVHAFKDSLEAFDKFKQSPQKFDLVITDMTMPKMTGERLSMKMLALKKDLPIILCTGYSERITQKEAQKIGILKFIEKPIVGPPLSKLIRDILDPKYMIKGEKSRPVS